jgi:hypothetical protein
MKAKQEPKDEDKFHSKGRKGHKGKTIESLFVAFAAFAVKYLRKLCVALMK